MSKLFVSKPASSVYGVLTVNVTPTALEFKGEIRTEKVDVVVSNRGELAQIFEECATILRESVYEPVFVPIAVSGCQVMLEQYLDDEDGKLDYDSAHLCLELGVELKDVGSCHLFLDRKGSAEFMAALLPLVQTP